MALPDMVDGLAADMGPTRGGTEQAVPIITVPDKASAVTHIPSWTPAGYSFCFQPCRTQKN